MMYLGPWTRSASLWATDTGSRVIGPGRPLKPEVRRETSHLERRDSSQSFRGGVGGSMWEGMDLGPHRHHLLSPCHLGWMNRPWKLID